MKRTYLSLLLIGLFSIGCTSMKKETQADQSKKTVAAKPANEPEPAPLARLLPAEQLDAGNARAQAQLLEETLKKENGSTEQTQAAARE